MEKRANSKDRSGFFPRVAFGVLTTLLMVPTASRAAAFTWQSPGGHLPMIVSDTPISGSDAFTLPFFEFDVTESIGLRWRADYRSLGLLMSDTIEGTVDLPFSSSPLTRVTQVESVDTVTIAGGSGAGILRLGLDVHGTEWLNSGANPFVFVQTMINSPGGLHSFNGPGLFAVDIPFTYGTPFELGRRFSLGVGFMSLGAEAAGNFGPFEVSADYSNSADFTFAVLDVLGSPVSGATVASDSGFMYLRPTPPPVPEPASMTLLSLGLVGAGALRCWKRTRTIPARTMSEL